ncbi:hypothetical protein ACOSP7_016817 [Xanthoceras sorbifolium]
MLTKLFKPEGCCLPFPFFFFFPVAPTVFSLSFSAGLLVLFAPAMVCLFLVQLLLAAVPLSSKILRPKTSVQFFLFSFSYGLLVAWPEGCCLLFPFFFSFPVALALFSLSFSASLLVFFTPAMVCLFLVQLLLAAVPLSSKILRPKTFVQFPLAFNSFFIISSNGKYTGRPLQPVF